MQHSKMSVICSALVLLFLSGCSNKVKALTASIKEVWIIQEVWIPMKDGAVLAADLYFPKLQRWETAIQCFSSTSHIAKLSRAPGITSCVGTFQNAGTSSPVLIFRGTGHSGGKTILRAPSGMSS